MLRATSLVNLENIYRENISGELPIAYLQPKEYEKMVKKLITFQENDGSNQDEFYPEIRELLG